MGRLMAAAKTLISLVDGVFVRVEGRLRRIDKGAPVPQGADAAHVKVLRSRGLVDVGEQTAGFVDPQAPAPVRRSAPSKPDAAEPSKPDAAE